MITHPSPPAAAAAFIIAVITIIVYNKKRLQNFINANNTRRNQDDTVPPREVLRVSETASNATDIGSEKVSSATDITTNTAEKDTSNCATCGKGGDDLKTCNACKLVKYCNANCQKAHRPKHKKKCQERAAELLDEALFKQPPPREDCPICFLRLPPRTRTTYQLCCGKVLCDGCMCAVAKETDTCPFCRGPSIYSNKEAVKRCKKRMEAGDAEAFLMLGCDYDDGVMGLPQDSKKAGELWIRAGELGHSMAHYNVASAYYEGTGVERNMKKAIKYYQLAAMEGHEGSRHNLACFEINAGNMTRAMKHFMIAAGAGDDDSLEAVTDGFVKGHVNKDEYEKTLRAHKDSNDEMKSDHRDSAIEARALDRQLASLLGR